MQKISRYHYATDTAFYVAIIEAMQHCTADGAFQLAPFLSIYAPVDRMYHRTIRARLYPLNLDVDWDAEPVIHVRDILTILIPAVWHEHHLNPSRLTNAVTYFFNSEYPMMKLIEELDRNPITGNTTNTYNM